MSHQQENSKERREQALQTHRSPAQHSAVQLNQTQHSRMVLRDASELLPVCGHVTSLNKKVTDTVKKSPIFFPVTLLTLRKKKQVYIYLLWCKKVLEGWKILGAALSLVPPLTRNKPALLAMHAVQLTVFPVNWAHFQSDEA